MTSQGQIMLSEGQEFARSKVIANTEAPDNRIWQVDRDPYAKDNETNWLNYHHKEINKDLFFFYRDLIELRREYSVLRRTGVADIRFLHCDEEFALGFVLPGQSSDCDYDITVLLNSDRQQAAMFSLPPGQWRVLSDGNTVNKHGFESVVENPVNVLPCKSLILKQERQYE
jgi:pullulanase/glycogen debranching enzyme